MVVQAGDASTHAQAALMDALGCACRLDKSVANGSTEVENARELLMEAEAGRTLADAEVAKELLLECALLLFFEWLDLDADTEALGLTETALETADDTGLCDTLIPLLTDTGLPECLAFALHADLLGLIGWLAIDLLE